MRNVRVRGSLGKRYFLIAAIIFSGDVQGMMPRGSRWAAGCHLAFGSTWSGVAATNFSRAACGAPGSIRSFVAVLFATFHFGMGVAELGEFTRAKHCVCECHSRKTIEERQKVGDSKVR